MRLSLECSADFLNGVESGTFCVENLPLVNLSPHNNYCAGDQRQS
jgi:hypothetical protein